MRGFSTFPYISSINSKYKLSHSLCGPPVVIMKKEMTELENKVKLLKLKIAKTEEIIHKRERQALERLRLSISSLASAVDELQLKIEEGKIGKGESEEEIALWDEEIIDNLERADNTTRRIHDAIKALDLKEVRKVW